MTGQEDKRPNELVEHAPVTLRRYRAEGTGIGVVWRLTR
jgi:hypothetical protein